MGYICDHGNMISAYLPWDQEAVRTTSGRDLCSLTSLSLSAGLPSDALEHLDSGTQNLQGNFTQSVPDASAFTEMTWDLPQLYSVSISKGRTREPENFKKHIRCVSQTLNFENHALEALLSSDDLPGLFYCFHIFYILVHLPDVVILIDFSAPDPYLVI